MHTIALPQKGTAFLTGLALIAFLSLFVGYGVFANTPTPTATATATTEAENPESTATTEAEPATEPDNDKEPKDFWAKGYQAKWISQTQSGTEDEYFVVSPGQVVEFQAVFENIGESTWNKTGSKQQVCINIYKDPNVMSAPEGTGYDQEGHEKYGRSYWAHESWIDTPNGNDFRITCIEEDTVAPGEQGTFTMQFQIPADSPTGKYREDITLASGDYWLESHPDTADPIGAAHIWLGFNVSGEETTPTATTTETMTEETTTPTAEDMTPTPAGTPVVNDSTILATYNLDEVNALRVAEGLPEFVVNDDLVAFAQEHANFMATEEVPYPYDNAADTSTKAANVTVVTIYTEYPDESGVSEALRKFPPELWGTNNPDPYGKAIRDGQDLFEEMTFLRNNILSEDYTEVGIAVAVQGDYLALVQLFK